MANKELINKLRDMAELAQASYGYFDLVTHDKNDFSLKLKMKLQNLLSLINTLLKLMSWILVIKIIRHINMTHL